MNVNTFGSMDVGLKIVPTSGKIYDITEADTNEHSVALPAGYPVNTKKIIVHCQRTVGTGSIDLRSTSGNSDARVRVTNTSSGEWVRSANGLFYYALTVANDTWFIHAVGYTTG